MEMGKLARLEWMEMEIRRARPAGEFFVRCRMLEFHKNRDFCAYFRRFSKMVAKWISREAPLRGAPEVPSM